MAEVKKRLNFVDMAKGLAILGVVGYHLLAPSPARTFLTHICDALVIAFFFFSGYFYRPGKRTVIDSIKSRVTSLLGPFVHYSTVFWVIGTIYYVAMGLVPLFEALCCLRNFYGGCIWNRVIQGWFNWEYYKLGSRYPFLADFWFLLAMFFASVVFFPIADRVLNSKGKTLGISVVFIAATAALRYFDISLPYNLQIVPFWTAIMLLGAFAGHQKLFDIEGLSGSGAKEWICALVALAGGIGLLMWKEPCANLFRGTFAAEPQNEPMAVVLCVVASLLFIWGVGEVCKLVELAGMRVQELSWLGSHSLIVYLYHMFFAWIVCTITGFSMKYEEPIAPEVLWGSVALTFGCLALCILRDIIGEKLTKAWEQRKTAAQA